MKKLIYPMLLLIAVAFTYSGCTPEERKNGGDGNGNDSTTTDPSVFMRVNANNGPNIDEVLALYAYGQAIIKNMNCTDPSSQYYQGAIHSIPTPDQMGGKVDSSCVEYTDSTFRAWNSCPHMYPTNSQLNFLTWHRLYIFYYEKNLRYYIAKGGAGFPGLGEEAANKFSLPYWDYTNDGFMPPLFRRNTAIGEGPVNLPENPLFEIGRAPSLIAGESIDYDSKDSLAINIDGTVRNVCLATMRQALDYNKFLALADVSEFSRGMEDRLHNVMHDYIGGAVKDSDKATEIYNRIFQSTKPGFGLMGRIPSAGFDPIFFLHHANVDRMMATWEATYGEITVEQMDLYAGNWETIKKIYNFWDAETGSWVTYNSMADMLNAAHAINYEYEFLPIPNEDAKGMEFAERQQIHEDPLPKASPIRLGSGVSEHRLSISAANFKGQDARYTVEVDLKFGKNMLQQLVAFAIPPDQDWNACDLDEDYVFGVSGFFGSTHGAHMDHGGGSMVAGQEFSHTIIFEVTRAVEELPEGEDLVIYLAPLNPENGPDFFIHGVKLFEQQRGA
ncbi:MAG: tyrosinase family protein [Bacteroidota bacterium]